MKRGQDLFQALMKAANYSLDYSIKIIGALGILWGIFIIFQHYAQKPVPPMQVSDLFQVYGAIILIAALVSVLIISLIMSFIKSEKFRGMRYIPIRKGWSISLGIYDTISISIVILYIIGQANNYQLPIDQTITNIVLAIAAGLTALTIAVYVSSNHVRELKGHRLLFLHEYGESLRKSYIDYLRSLGYDNANMKSLSDNNWLHVEIENWPKKETIDQIQGALRNQSVNFSNGAQPVISSHSRLLESVKSIASIANTRLFDENRDLVVQSSLDAYFYVSNLWVILDPISGKPPIEARLQLTLIENQLKDSANCCGVVLMDLCKFANRMKPLLKNRIA